MWFRDCVLTKNQNPNVLNPMKAPLPAVSSTLLEQHKLLIIRHSPPFCFDYLTPVLLFTILLPTASPNNRKNTEKLLGSLVLLLDET